MSSPGSSGNRDAMFKLRDFLNSTEIPFESVEISKEDIVTVTLKEEEVNLESFIFFGIFKNFIIQKNGFFKDAIIKSKDGRILFYFMVTFDDKGPGLECAYQYSRPNANETESAAGGGGEGGGGSGGGHEDSGGGSGGGHEEDNSQAGGGGSPRLLGDNGTSPHPGCCSVM